MHEGDVRACRLALRFWVHHAAEDGLAGGWLCCKALRESETAGASGIEPCRHRVLFLLPLTLSPNLPSWDCACFVHHGTPGLPPCLVLRRGQQTHVGFPLSTLGEVRHLSCYGLDDFYVLPLAFTLSRLVALSAEAALQSRGRALPRRKQTVSVLLTAGAATPEKCLARSSYSICWMDESMGECYSCVFSHILMV